MVLLLRIFGVLAAIGTVIYAIVMFSAIGSGNGAAFGLVLATILSLAFTVLWFWLASRLSARRRAAWEHAMSLPCQQCGSSAAIGYRVCSSCGRVKAAGI